MKDIFLFLIGLGIYILLDFIWIGIISKKFYKKYFSGFGRIERGKWKVLFFPAFLTWALIIMGIFIFVHRVAESSLDALFYGAIMGFIIYGVYDFTNLSTIKEWSLKLSIVDLLWGTVAAGIVSFVLFLIKFRF